MNGILPYKEYCDILLSVLTLLKLWPKYTKDMSKLNVATVVEHITRTRSRIQQYNNYGI